MYIHVYNVKTNKYKEKLMYNMIHSCIINISNANDLNYKLQVIRILYVNNL